MYKPTKTQKDHVQKHGYMPNTLAQERTIKRVRQHSERYKCKVNDRTGIATCRFKQSGTFRISPHGKILKGKGDG